MTPKKIGMLGGGNMAGALVRGLLAGRELEPHQVMVSDVRAERLAELQREFGVSITADNQELARFADLVVCAVKPQVVRAALSTVGAALGGKLLVSIAAGVPTSLLDELVPADVRIVRVMPNTAAIALAGVAAVAPGPRATTEDVTITRALFDKVGRSVTVDESLIDAVTGLSGSGPAYVMLMIEALAEGGVRAGLPRDTALLLAAQTVYGSAKLLVESGEHPARLREMVTSPGGTTAAGLFALERAAVRHAFMDAVGAAAARATELGLALRPKP